MNVPLRLTGHPLIDVGIATLCAMAGRGDPDALTEDDLKRAAEEMAQAYFSPVMISYIACVFPNSEYVQPGSGEKKDEKRRLYSKQILGAYAFDHPLHPGAAGLKCAYSGLPATHLVHRQQLPMFTGANVSNFLPEGLGALPIAGPYLTALQALPLGGRKAEGRLLAVHSESWDLTLWFARLYLKDNRRILGLLRSQAALPPPESSFVREIPKAEKEGLKYGDVKFPSSLVMHDLTSALAEIDRNEGAGASMQTATAYWLSNSGQGPSIDIFHIPATLVNFLDAVTRDSRASMEWGRVVGAGWKHELPGGKKKPTFTGPGRTKNSAFSDLTEIFASGSVSYGEASRFVQFHLLGQVQNAKLRRRMIGWVLVEIFLTELLSMDQSRILSIKQLADRLAEHIKNRNDKRLLERLVYAKRISDFRVALTNAQRREYKEHDTLLFTLEEFLTVFEADDAVSIAPWNLIRDLISIRLIERLHDLKFQTEDLFENEPDEQAQEDSSAGEGSEN